MKIAITGHRPDKLDNDYELKSDLIRLIGVHIISIITDVCKKNNITFKDIQLITGMALGIDTLFANIAITLDIKFIAAIPCINQEKMWPQSSKERYKKIINNILCTQYYVTNQEYTLSCMQKRNKYMVNNCDLLIAVWDGTEGGTKNCIDYANKIGKNIIYINPNIYRKK